MLNLNRAAPAAQERSMWFTLSILSLLFAMPELQVFSFDDDHVEPQTASAPSGLFGWVLCVLPAVAAGLILGVQPPYALEPATAGFLWAGVFLVGFAVGGLVRGQLAATIICGAFCWLATHAFTVITDFAPAESLLLSTLNLLAGWLCALSSTNHWSSLRNRGDQDPTSEISRPEGHRQFGLWDIAFLTVVVALVSSCSSAVVSPMALIACGVAAAVGGLVSSWIASRLAWHDEWKLFHVAAFGFIVVLLIVILVVRSPMPAWSTITWLVAGPVSTIAAEGTTVLFFCAALRWDLSYRRKSFAQNQPSTT